LGVVRDDLFEPQFGGGTVGAVEDAAEGAGHFGPLIQAGDRGLGVLLEMELAALPGPGGKGGPAGRWESGVVVTNDAGDDAKAALHEALERGAPVDFGLTQG
jgi:hypothetical protein